jgi:hypothetical protein
MKSAISWNVPSGWRRDSALRDHRDPAPVLVQQLELDLRDRALDLQQRRPVRLVEDPPAHGQELGDLERVLELVALAADPSAQRVVDAQDPAVDGGQEEPAWRRVVQRARGRQRRLVGGRAALHRQRSSAPRNSCIASAQALGSLRCGQWPTLLITRSVERGSTRCM